jgi:hypothetical protein
MEIKLFLITQIFWCLSHSSSACISGMASHPSPTPHWGWTEALYTCQASALLLELHSQPWNEKSLNFYTTCTSPFPSLLSLLPQAGNCPYSPVWFLCFLQNSLYSVSVAVQVLICQPLYLDNPPRHCCLQTQYPSVLCSASTAHHLGA